MKAPSGLEDYRLYAVVASMGYLGIVVHLLLIPLFWWMGVTVMALLNIASSAVWICAWLVNRRGRRALAIGLMTGEIVVHSLAAARLVGWEAGFQYYLMGAVGVVPYTLFNTRLGSRGIVILTLVLWVLFSLLYALTRESQPTLRHPEALAWLYYLNVFITFLGLGLSSYSFRQVSIRYEAQLRQLASTDELTGLPNRRAIWELLEREAALARRGGSPASLILADIDRFKEVNDSHGHACGDRVLRDAGRVLGARLRRSDVLARWGGEELLVLLPGASLEDALRLAEEIRSLASATAFECVGRPVSITLTLGVARHRPGESMEETLRRADEALYRGKAQGRDCVVAET